LDYKLHHYLADEHQVLSALAWNILRLLMISKLQDNLSIAV